MTTHTAMANTAEIDFSSEKSLWPVLDVGTKLLSHEKRKAVLEERLASDEDIQTRAHSERWGAEEDRSIVPGPDTFNDLQRITQRRLGYRSGRRIKKLSSYKAGWDSYDARAASPLSASLLAAFLFTYKVFPTKPSIFLTRNGYFELAWENRKGQRLSVVFEDASCRVSTEEWEGEFRVFGAYDVNKVAHSLNENPE